MDSATTNPSLRLEPFRVEVHQELLEDLRTRLERVRYTEELADTDWEYGVPGALVREQVKHWRERYDWRRWEKRLNRWRQFVTNVDGQRVHFLHVRSHEPDALPLILSHGWPGSVFEFVDVIAPLVDPRAHHADPADAFDVVVPSLPGFAFSGPTRERGWNTERIAVAWRTLMSGLGYRRFGAVGNDWGSDISIRLGQAAPDAVIGVHVTQIVSLPRGDAGELDGLTDEEQAALNDRAWYHEHMDAYHHVQAQQPQTLAHALVDSPVGLLAWFDTIFRGGVDIDFALTAVHAHWLTGTVASAMRLYRENGLISDSPTRSTVPLGLAQFAHDFRSIRRFAERDHANIVSWNVYDHGSHFAAHDATDALAADIRSFFRALR
jgi:pimeloyl-ACP methyl ester carboxylesterase